MYYIYKKGIHITWYKKYFKYLKNAHFCQYQLPYIFNS